MDGNNNATFVNQLPDILTSMLGTDTPWPRVVMTDRGPGFYQPARGAIVRAYGKALKENGFRPCVGEDAAWQPGDLADIFMHETVVAWVRRYFRKNPVTQNKGLEANKAAVIASLKACEKHINKEYDVRALCSSMPKRTQMLLSKEADRLKY